MVSAMKTGIYARQSIEKQDSVSIEAQIEKCELICKLNNWDCSIYKDVGYSGSNMDRPGFEKLIKDIEQGKITKVIAYRLDRISRSISDFANLLTLFEKHNVQFMSATENFDTSSPIGRAMVYIVMVFAQLERETLTARITDNYFYRAKGGFFTGGNCPFGYKPTKITHNGKKASVLEVDPETSEIIKCIFDKYAAGHTLHKISHDLNSRNVSTQNGVSWSSSKIRRILKNPAYVENTIDVYEFFSRIGCKISNPPSEFDGKSGLFLHGKEKGRKNRKQVDITDQTLSIGRFLPIVDSKTWINAQYRLNGNNQAPRSGTSKKSWLSGLVSCGVCGYSVGLKYTKKKEKEYTYFHCRGANDRGICDNRKCISATYLEELVKQELFEKISSKQFLDMCANVKVEVDSEVVIKKNDLTQKLYSIDNEINNYLSSIGRGTSVVDSYLTQKITSLDSEKQIILNELSMLDTEIFRSENQILNTEYLKELAKQVNNFDKLDFGDKHILVSAFIKKLHIYNPENIEIDWFFLG